MSIAFRINRIEVKVLKKYLNLNTAQGLSIVRVLFFSSLWGLGDSCQAHYWAICSFLGTFFAINAVR